jgi:hypothetical protein
VEPQSQPSPQSEQPLPPHPAEEIVPTKTEVAQTDLPASFEAEPEPGAANDDNDAGESYTWQASEYIFHEKPLLWYGVFWLVIAVISGVLAFLRQWLSLVVVVAMSLAVVTYSRKQPRTLEYRIDDKGVTVDGRTLPHDQFRSFSVWEDVGWHEVDLEPTRRFVPRLTLICESEDVEHIVELMSQHLPRHDRHPDLIERATRYLRF